MRTAGVREATQAGKKPVLGLGYPVTEVSSRGIKIDGSPHELFENALLDRQGMTFPFCCITRTI